ncbi:MAG: hypothetical protein N3C12_10160 [Candidatus Binatia bacterium]|nr:hypothetical protein [Candidatus Binatia bacterium]
MVNRPLGENAVYPGVHRDGLRANLVIAWLLGLFALGSAVPSGSFAPTVLQFRPEAQRRLEPAKVSTSVERQMRRWVTRTERLTLRVLDAAMGIVWVLAWLATSTALFAGIAGVVGAVDQELVRGLRTQWVRSMRLAWRGTQVFWKSARDRALPLAPRVVLLLAWAYWLSPVDLLGEDWSWASVIDDGFVAAGAGRLFVHLCPNEVLQRNAAKLQIG